MSEEQQPAIPEPQAQGGDPASSTGEQGGGLLAGKYATEADLDNGISESVSFLNLGSLARNTFTDAADKEAYYNELSSFRGRSVTPSTPAPTPTQPANELAIQKPTDLVTSDMSISDVIQKAGVSQDDIATHFLEHGQVSPKDIQKIQRVLPGFSATMINDQARMSMNDAKYQGHLNQQITAGAEQIAGGRDQLANLMLFATSLPESVRKSLNTALKGPDTYQDAIHTMMRRQLADGGGAAVNATQGQGSAPSGIRAAPFNNNRELATAKKDKRYGPDLAYTREVDARFAATPEHVLGS